MERTCLALLLTLPALAGAQPLALPAERTAPAPHCLDARGVRQMEQAAPAAIAVLAANGQAYQLALEGPCPGVNAASEVRLDAPGGWACGRPGETLVVDGRACPVAAVQPIDGRTFADTARRSSRDYATTLSTVTVTGKGGDASRPRHTFQGSAEFCFATRNVRAWSEDPQGVVVETNPRRNGGHRYYRLELAGSCSILAGATDVDFQSGFQNGLICGNPGDRIVMANNGMQGDLRMGTPRFARPGCSVLAVYPKK
ncbi:DUF6491 family protein [Stenotrophomonas sp.]|uniref:DUF6491 family protein n=1 Tax=Stenotrophomonas sp. TaxID=69392 RepID=UPI002FC8EF89